MVEPNIQVLTEENARLQDEVKRLQTEVSYHDLQRQRANERHDADMRDLAQAFIEQKRQYELRINQLSQDNDDLQLEISEYRRENALAEADRHQLRQQLNEVTVVLSDIQGSLASVDLDKLRELTD